MPASEETFRSQPNLHIVFAISSIAMTITIVWMTLADHLRPWKEVQREFHYVEDAKLRATEKEKQREQQTKHKGQLDEIDAKIKQAEADRDQNASEIRK